MERRPRPNQRRLMCSYHVVMASRRRFIRNVVAAGLAAGGTGTEAQQTGRVRGFDHVALPMQNTEAMVAFYRRLGFDVAEGPTACSVYIGDQMINFHRPAHWQDQTFKVACSGGQAAVRRSMLRLGRHAGRAEGDAGSGHRQNHRRSGGPPRRQAKGRVERVCAGSGWEPAGIHDLFVSHPLYTVL